METKWKLTVDGVEVATGKFGINQEGFPYHGISYDDVNMQLFQKIINFIIEDRIVYKWKLK